MNDYLERQLREALSAAVQRRYGKEVQSWTDEGATVEQDEAPQWDPQGNHHATVTFTLTKDGQSVQRRALYRYKRPPRGEAHWYMERDWND